MSVCSRRAWLVGGLSLPALGAVAPDALPVRKTAFEIRGNDVCALLRADELLAADDPDAMGLLTSGFVVRLLWYVELFRRERTGRTSVARVRLDNKLYWDPWATIFVLHGQVHAAAADVTYFRDPTALLAAALHPVVKVAAVDQLARDGTRYFVRVLAMRNPFEPGRREARPVLESEGVGVGAAMGGDGSFWSFPRLVALFSRRPARAEVVSEYRSNDFFLGGSP